MLAAIGLVTGWIGLSRLRRRGFADLPRQAAVALLGVAPVALVAAVVVPSMVGNDVAPGPRPRSTATIAFVRPAPGEVVAGEDVTIDLRLEGGRIVQETATDIASDTGHVHLYLDGELQTMTSTRKEDLPVADLAPGVHRLLAEYVAADHAPFAPRVTASVSFVTKGGR